MLFAAPASSSTFCCGTNGHAGGNQNTAPDVYADTQLDAHTVYHTDPDQHTDSHRHTYTCGHRYADCAAAHGDLYPGPAYGDLYPGPAHGDLYPGSAHGNADAQFSFLRRSTE
jgi:hypothetical protein